MGELVMPKELKVGDLMVYVGMDSKEYDKGVDKMQGGLEKLANGVKIFFSAMVVKEIVDGVGQITDAYGRFEQVVGGVEKLFGESADAVKAYADNAWKTAGISATQYMQTVTGFSAGLIRSLEGDTEKASRVADMAIQDMADNANTFGVSLQEVQDIYQSIARGNYQTLDSLALGFAGTKQGMQDLIDEANRLNAQKGIFSQYTIDNLADVYEAIHVVQEDLGITGTTAREAEKTLEGSTNAMKASFENLKVAIAGGGDLKNAVQTFGKTIVTYLKNLIPRVVQILKNIPTLFREILSGLPDLIREIVPMILDGIRELPSMILETFRTLLPEMLNFGLEMLLGLANGILEGLPTLIGYLPQIVYAITEFFANSFTQIAEAGMQLLMAIVANMPTIVQAIVNALPAIFMAIEATLVNHLPEMAEAGFNLLVGLVKLLPVIIIEIAKAIPAIVLRLFEMLRNEYNGMAEKGKELFSKLSSRVSETFETAKSKAKEYVNKVKDGIVSGFSAITQAGRNLVTGLWNGISGGWDWLVSQVRGLASRLVNSVKDRLGIHSPSTVFAGIGENLAEGLNVGYTVEWDEFEHHALNSFRDMVNTMNGMDVMGKDIGYSLGQTLTADALEPVTTQVVLDGKVIAESTNTYNRNLQLAVGMR